MAAVSSQGAAIVADGVVDRLLQPLRLAVAEQVVNGDEQGRVGQEPDAAVDPGGELCAGLDLVFGLRLGHVSFGVAQDLAPHLAAPALDHLRHVQARVPDLQVGHVGESPDRLPIRLHGADHDGPSDSGVKAAAARGHLQAGREAFEVPFERARQRLVEVIDVEKHLSFGRGETPEVGKVSVSAQLHGESRMRHGR